MEKHLFVVQCNVAAATHHHHSSLQKQRSVTFSFDVIDYAPSEGVDNQWSHPLQAVLVGVLPLIILERTVDFT